MIVLFKLGTQIKFQGIKLDRVRIENEQEEEYRANGWGCAWDILKESKGETKKEPVKFEEVDTNESGLLSVDEVRNAAKEAGIDGWEKKRIKTLKKELGLDDVNEHKDN